MKISVALITLNEEMNIQGCLDSVVEWADEIVVVDGGSTDQTLSLARRYPVKIIQNPFVNFSAQKNEALRHVTGDWVFFIDADERATAQLGSEIREIAATQKADALYEVLRKTYFLGRRLKYSGTQNDHPTRFFPVNKAHFEQPVHEIVVSDLPTKILKNTLWHFSTRDLSHYLVKMDQYVSFEVQTMASKSRKIYFWDLLLRPVAKFLYLYFYKRGMLDGIAGLYFAALSSIYDFKKCRKFIDHQSKHAQFAQSGVV